MNRTVSIGCQDFGQLITNDYFYIDKTHFIKEWWENGDSVTLITRPRRFGKTLTMNMLERFFSIRYAGQGNLFAGFSIWKEEKYRLLQGTYPVISLSFSDIKETSFADAKRQFCSLLSRLYRSYAFLLESDCLMDLEKEEYLEFSREMPAHAAARSLNLLSEYLYRYYGKKVIILLDEYDTPMQEAYVGSQSDGKGYWEDLVAFTRNLFHATFKSNPYLDRAILTGITRISKESIFSDLNNLVVVSTTSEEYQDSFGFTEEEVFAALDEYGLSEQKSEVKYWYDGFTFGSKSDIYNPWSILHYLKIGHVGLYWANTSSNSLAGKLIREGDSYVKKDFERLLRGETLWIELDEQIVYNQLLMKKNALWSLLLASGYLKVVELKWDADRGRWYHCLALTNKEVHIMFEQMVEDWFFGSTHAYNDFLTALLSDDIKAMNIFMNEVALQTFSFFDTGKSLSRKTEPERFYHGFVLGLMVELSGRYLLTSNRESGFGRYDVMLEPLHANDPAFLLEFKVHDPTEEANLQDTVSRAIAQINEKNYAATLTAKGISKHRIRQYGFAFEGKSVLIGN